MAISEEDIAKVDRFVDNAMDTLMKTVDYDTLVAVCREYGAPEDFSDIKTNFPRTEFEEKYDHKKAKTKVTYSTLAADYAMDVERINSYSPAELAESSAFVADFYEELDEIDLAILKLKIEGKNPVKELLNSDKTIEKERNRTWIYFFKYTSKIHRHSCSFSFKHQAVL